jgi:hypothetical protein
LQAVSATFFTCDGLACLPARLIFRGRRWLCAEPTTLPRSFHARRIIAGNGSSAPIAIIGVAAVIKPVIVNAISNRLEIYNGNAALAAHVGRRTALSAAFKRSVPRNESATFAGLAPGRGSSLIRYASLGAAPEGTGRQGIWRHSHSALSSACSRSAFVFSLAGDLPGVVLGVADGRGMRRRDRALLTPP